jgi:D-alanyl-D-alanine carboxypeptidase
MFNMKKVCCLLTLLLAAHTHLFSQAFTAAVDSIRKYRSVPGIAYAVFTDDKIIDIGAVGVRKLKAKENITINDRFNIGTNTTAFTTYVAARLSENGKLNWNTNVIKVWPELNGKSMKLYHRVTLQQLLSQRAGIKPYAELNDFRAVPALTGSITEQRRTFAAHILKQTPLLIVDSSKGVYSVAGTTIAASMMEKITRKPWEDLVNEYINKPLNITTYFGLPNQTDSLQPSGHWNGPGYLVAEPGSTGLRPIPAVAPATAINISLKNYIVFLQDFLKALQNKKAHLSNVSVLQLLFGNTGYSLGWENEVWNDLNITHYLGKGYLFSSYTEIIQEKNIGIIVLCNSGAVSGQSAALNIGRLLREHYGK